VVDEGGIAANLRILDRVQQEAGAKILLALKAFALFALAPSIMRTLKGVCASGLYEARLGREVFGGEVHCFSPAYRQEELEQILACADHVLFNSFGQWDRFQPLIQAARRRWPGIHFGLRINPEHSEGWHPLYDPCAPHSRMGIPRAQFAGRGMEGIDGLHFHTLCEQDFPPFSRTLAVVEEGFGPWLGGLRWINFGGGHLITHADYQVDDLIRLIQEFRQRWDLEVYLEPGEAIALDAGVLVAEVLDITWNGRDIAILDVSASCHMPDILEIPYRPAVQGAGQPGRWPYDYRLAGRTCLSGDILGDYSFPQPLQIGDRLLFHDMAVYTMVKNTTFNGLPLPAIALWNSDTDELRVIKQFGYEDFRQRLS